MVALAMVVAVRLAAFVLRRIGLRSEALQRLRQWLVGQGRGQFDQRFLLARDRQLGERVPRIGGGIVLGGGGGGEQQDERRDLACVRVMHASLTPGARTLLRMKTSASR